MNNKQTNGGWRKNERSGPDDWTCPRCRKHNPLEVAACMLCGGTAVTPRVTPRVARAKSRVKSSKRSLIGEWGVCLRNKTNHTLWFYWEMTAPVHWVQLRSGEACDLPAPWGTQVVTIGASFEEPNPAEIVGLQFAFAFGVLAFPVLALLPEPGSKALLAYVISAVATTGAFAGGTILMAVSNASNLKQVGVDTHPPHVWELTEDLLRDYSLADGDKVGEYSFHWTQVDVPWSQRFFGEWAEVEHGEDRGKLEELDQTPFGDRKVVLG